MKTHLLLFVLAAACVSGAIAQSQKQSLPAITRLETDIPRLMKTADVPGMSVAVISNGKLVWGKGFGVTNINTREPVTRDTVFDANSLSKVVFAYAVLTLVDRRKFDLDVPIYRYLGDNSEIGTDPRIEQITARRILSHSSGLAHVRPKDSATIPFVFDPGKKFEYSTEGILYLAKAIEKVTGQKIEAFIEKAVLTPLMMKDSSYVWLDSYERRIAYNHDSFGQLIPKRYKHTRGLACCSLLTTADDYAKFVIAAMNGKLLKSETWNEMAKPQIALGQDSPQLFWGFGWGIEKTSDGESLWHWGDNGISKSYVTAFLPKKNAVVFFANSDNGLSFVDEILDATVGGPHPGIKWLNYDKYDSVGWRLFESIKSSGAEVALKEYRKKRISDPKASLNESQMNILGYKFLQAKRTDDAVEIFMQNTLDFPLSGNTWDSLGEAYMEKDEKHLAIKSYEKSLQIDPKNSNAVEMLKKLKREK